MSTIIEAVDLVREFAVGKGLFSPGRTVHAVSGVSFRVRKGETFAIVGESGCGKSTLARTLARLIAPTSGEVVIDDQPVGRLKGAALTALRRKVQFIFQDPFSSLNPRMTVGALIGEPMEIHRPALTAKQRRAEVAELLGRVGLRAAHMDRYPHEFSGGQRQRIGIARALAAEPEILVGDEPVSALDVSVQAQVINLLHDLKTEFGLTLIVVAHDLAVIRHMADRVAVMYLGEVVEEAPAEALFDRPRHPYSAALMAAIPIAAAGARPVRAEVKGEPPNPIAPPTGCRFHPRCPHAQALCREEHPALRAVGEGHRAACHFAEDLALDGIAGAAPARSAAAERRFALLAAATKSGAEPAPRPHHPINTEEPIP